MIVGKPDVTPPAFEAATISLIELRRIDEAADMLLGLFAAAPVIPPPPGDNGLVMALFEGAGVEGVSSLRLVVGDEGLLLELADDEEVGVFKTKVLTDFRIFDV